MAANITIHGAKELERKLRALPLKVENKIARKALREGARPILAEAKQQVPVKSGLLRRKLTIRAGKRSRKHGPRIVVQTSEGLFKGEAFYGGFVHFGHRIGPRRLGPSRKLVPANEFLKRAAEKSKDQAGRIVVQQVEAGIIREAKGP